MNKEQLEEEFVVWGFLAAIATVIISYIWHHPFLIHLEMALAVTTIVIGIPVELLLSKGFRQDSEKNEERKFNIDNTINIITALAALIPALLAALAMDNSMIHPTHPVLYTVFAGFFGGLILGFQLSYIYCFIRYKISQ